MSLWYCPKCGTLMNNSMVCRFGCGDTSRVTHIDTNIPDDHNKIIDDLMITYCPEMNDDEEVKASKNRIEKAGGTLAYMSLAKL